MIPNDPLPLRHLARVNFVLPGNLPHRFYALQSGQPHFGFEGPTVSFPFSFTHSSAVVSCSAEPEKSNLTSGPNSGVHFIQLAIQAGRDGQIQNEFVHVARLFQDIPRNDDVQLGCAPAHAGGNALGHKAGDMDGADFVEPVANDN
jgi:hypothetical protein